MVAAECKQILPREIGDVLAVAGDFVHTQPHPLRMCYPLTLPMFSLYEKGLNHTLAVDIGVYQREKRYNFSKQTAK